MNEPTIRDVWEARRASFSLVRSPVWWRRWMGIIKYWWHVKGIYDWRHKDEWDCFFADYSQFNS